MIHDDSSRNRRASSRDQRGAQGTGSAVFGGACPAALPQTGTGAKKKGAIPQQAMPQQEPPNSLYLT